MNMRHTRFPAALLAATLLAAALGCGVEVDVPDRRPTSADIKSWSHKSITRLEAAIRNRDPNLPSKTRPVVHYLYSLRANLTDGDGAKFKNTEEALDAVDRVIAKLDEWYNRSKLRREGETDEDFAELQAVVDEVKEVLRNTKTGD